MTPPPAPRPTPHSRRELFLATLFFVAVTMVLAYPMSLHPATLRVDVGADGDLGWFILSWDTHAFLHRPWAIFDANFFYPDRYTLAYGENIIGLAFLAAPVIWLTGNPALATTLGALVSCVMCGLGAYVLAKRVGVSVAGALICGLIFVASPPHLFRIGQITLIHVEWIPFTLAYLHAYFDSGRPSDLRLAVGFTSLQVLSTGHGAVFVAVAIVLFLAYRFLLGEPLNVLTRVRDFGITGACLLLPSVLLFVPYHYVQEAIGFRRNLGNWWYQEFRYFLASPTYVHRWLYELVGATDLLNAEVTLFPGFLAIMLAGVALVLWREPRSGEVTDRAALAWRRVGTGVEATLVGSAILGAFVWGGSVMGFRVGSIWLESPTLARMALFVFAASVTLRVGLRRHLAVGGLARLRRPVLLIAGVALLLIVATLLRSGTQAGDGLVAEYFSTRDWTGPPAMAVVDPQLSGAWMLRRWDGNAPEQFSARWTGFISIPRAGVYTFSTTSDDASFVFIDGQSTPIVDNGGMHSPLTRSGRIGLNRGAHRIEVRYVQGGGDATLNLAWSRNGGLTATVPAWALSRNAPSLRSAIIARVLDCTLSVLVAVLWLSVLWAVLRWSEGGQLAGLGRVARSVRQSARGFYLTVTLFSFALALGPPYGLWQYVYAVPPFSFIRVSSRFTLLTLVGLAVLAGMGFDAATRRVSRRKRFIWAAAACLVLMVEYYAVPIGYTQTHWEIPAIDRWLDTVPKPFVVAEVPIRDEQDQVDYMNHSTAHWQKTVHGWDGFRRAFHERLYVDLAGFPDDRSLERIKEVGITYMVVHQDRYSLDDWRQVDERLTRYGDRLRLVHAEGAGRVYSVVR